MVQEMGLHRRTASLMTLVASLMAAPRYVAPEAGGRWGAAGAVRVLVGERPVAGVFFSL